MSLSLTFFRTEGIRKGLKVLIFHLQLKYSPGELHSFPCVFLSKVSTSCWNSKPTLANNVDIWSSWKEYGISATGNFFASLSESWQPSCRLLLNILIGWKLMLDVEGTGRLFTISGGGATYKLRIEKLGTDVFFFGRERRPKGGCKRLSISFRVEVT